MSNEQIARGSVLSIVAELDKRDAEIERLRCQLAVCGVFARGGDMTCLPEYETDSVIAVRQLRAEIERLRSQLAAMERGYKSFRDTAETEYARLRGLLREAEKMWPNPGLSTESSQWYKRVREALGK